MSNIAGGTGPQKGVAFAGLAWKLPAVGSGRLPAGGYVRLDEQYGVDTFNTFYVEGSVPLALGERTTLTLGAQYYPQRSVGAAGSTAAAIYAQGRERIDSATGAPMPDRNETDVRVDYAFGKTTLLDGLVATLRYAWQHQDGSAHTATQLRAILNHAVRFWPGSLAPRRGERAGERGACLAGASSCDHIGLADPSPATHFRLAPFA